MGRDGMGRLPEAGEDGEAGREADGGPVKEGKDG